MEKMMRVLGQQSLWKVWGIGSLSNVIGIVFQHCDNLSLFPVVPGTAEFIAFATQKDNIQTNDCNNMRNKFLKRAQRKFMDIQGGQDHYFFWKGK